MPPHPAFTWVLGVQTKALMIVQQAPYPSVSFSPFIFVFRGNQHLSHGQYNLQTGKCLSIHIYKLGTVWLIYLTLNMRVGFGQRDTNLGISVKRGS